MSDIDEDQEIVDNFLGDLYWEDITTLEFVALLSEEGDIRFVPKYFRVNGERYTNFINQYPKLLPYFGKLVGRTGVFGLFVFNREERILQKMDDVAMIVSSSDPNESPLVLIPLETQPSWKYVPLLGTSGQFILE